MADKRLIFRVHALKRMFEREISVGDVKQVITDGKTIEKYADDKPYPSSLILGWVGSKPIHVVRAENDYEIFIITVYEPDLEHWHEGYERRRK